MRIRLWREVALLTPFVDFLVLSHYVETLGFRESIEHDNLGTNWAGNGDELSVWSDVKPYIKP